MSAIRKLLIKIKLTFLNKKFIEFCVLGVINTLNDAIFSSLYHYLGLQDNLAAVVGYYTALTIAFFLSSYIIFKRQPTLKRYIKFFVSYIPNFIIFYLVTYITFNTMNLPQFWGTILAAAVGGPITFVIMKVFTFGKNDNL